MATLVLIRHSKAEPHRGVDHERELAPRGRSDAAELRDWLQGKGITPSYVVVSTATRTRQTWECCSVGTFAPVYDERVYDASVTDLLGVLSEAPGQGTVVLVGHNPSVEQLAWHLDDSPEARERTDTGLSTSGAAVFEDWSGDSARLVAFRG